MRQAASRHPGIFICYRREDAAGHAGRLFDRLAAHFGEGEIFMDVDRIEPGEDFVRVIREAVGSCETVLVLIGRNWLGSRDRLGRRRLDDPNDYVRLELAAALSRRVQIIPLLVQGARMPSPQELPAPLSALSLRSALELSDVRWGRDVEQLIATIERVRGAGRNAARPRGAGGAAGRGALWANVGLGLVIALVLFGMVAAYMYARAEVPEDEQPAAEEQRAASATPTPSPTPTPTPAPAASPTPDAAASKAVEVAFWNSVRKDDEEELEAYLRKYPEGEFKDLASIRLAKLGKTVVFDVGGSSGGAGERARLDDFAAALREVPAAAGYIMAYGGRRGPADEAQKLADRARAYLVGSRGIDASRIVTVDSGYREKATLELWIVPAGAAPPASSPTVDPSDVRIVAPRPSRGAHK